MTNILQDILERTDANHPFPEDGTDEEILNWHRKNVWIKVKKFREERKDSGITVYGRRWDSDAVSRVVMTAEVIAILSGRRADGEIWRTADNEDQELSNEEYLGLATCIKVYASRIMSASWILRFAIDRLPTVEACHAYDYTEDRIWPSSIFESIPVGWTTSKIPILGPLLAKIDHLEHEVLKIEGAVDAIPVPPIADATNTRLRLYPSPRRRDKDYWAYIRADNDQLTPERDLSLHKVRFYVDLDKEPTSSSNCTWKKLTGNTYSLTPNAQEIEADKKLTISLKFVNIRSVSVTNLRYASSNVL